MTIPQQNNPEATEARPRSPGRIWIRRLIVAVLLGIAIGAGVGVFGVKTLEPGNPGTPDSLQMLLDSVANAKVAAESDTRRESESPPADTVTIASNDTATTLTVPNLADVEEGEARRILDELGFSVGTVMFRRSSKAVGTVLSTFPVAGEVVTLPTTVNLVLSDGRGTADSVYTPEFR